MPVLKSIAFTPLTREAVVLDLGDLARQAAKLKEAAERSAMKIVEAGRAEAQQRAAAIEQQAAEAGDQRGYAEGLERGRLEGVARAQQAAAAELAVLREQWHAALAAFTEERDRLRRDAERGVLDLALALAEKVVRQVVLADPHGVVMEQVRAALVQVMEPTAMAVHVNPGDRELIAGALPGLLDTLHRPGDVVVVEDEAVSRGGCRVSFAEGGVDATLETQLIRLASLLVPASDEVNAGLLGPEADISSPGGATDA